MQITFDPLPAASAASSSSTPSTESASAVTPDHRFPHDIHRRRTMTGRDRIVDRRARRAGRGRRRLAAGRRPRARKGGEARRRSQHRAVAAVHRRRPGERAPAARRRATRRRTPRSSSLGKAVPTGQEVPSLIVQLAQATNEKQRRIHLDHLRRQRRRLQREPRRAAALRRLHRDAVHVRVQRQLLRPLRPLPAAQPLHRCARAPAACRSAAACSRSRASSWPRARLRLRRAPAVS